MTMFFQGPAGRIDLPSSELWQIYTLASQYGWGGPADSADPDGLITEINAAEAAAFADCIEEAMLDIPNVKIDPLRAWTEDMDVNDEMDLLNSRLFLFATFSGPEGKDRLREIVAFARAGGFTIDC